MFTPDNYSEMGGCSGSWGSSDSSGDEDLDTVDYQKEASDEDDE